MEEEIKFPNREILCEMGYEDSVCFENPDYDEAIVGVDSNGRIVYSYEKMVEHLKKVDGMSEEDAIEFIDFNTLGRCTRICRINQSLCTASFSDQHFDQQISFSPFVKMSKHPENPCKH